MDTENRIPETWTVNETVLRHPLTVRVFSAHGIDTCCGGAFEIRHAAERHGIDAGALLAELNRVASAPDGEPAMA